LVMVDDALPVRIEELLEHRAWVRALARSLVRDESTALDLELSLAGIANGAEPRRRYSRAWWFGEVLILRAYLGYAEVKESLRVAKDALARMGAHADFGILERSPYRKELEELRARAEHLASRLE
ncbi:MAG: hypothetical protein ACYS99_02450, partial [Planctomycetota bacterium]